MVRRLQDMEKGINERLEEEEEPMLLEGIKLDINEEEEEKINQAQQDFETKRKELLDAKDRSLAAFDMHYNKDSTLAIDDISKKIYE
jgi:hypothetical protein